MLTIVIDTNVLLQCPPLEQLDWATFDPDGVCVIIPHAVIGEIDTAKSSGTTRRAKKARAVASMIGAALDADRNGGTLGQKKGTWELGSGIVATDGRLDPNIPDHRIIAEALQISRDTPETAYLTGDNLARVRAKSVGLRVLPLPDAWLLAAEPDEREKRMREMERQLTELTKQAPRIVLGVTHDGHPIERFSTQFAYLREPSEQELDTLLALVERTHPPAEAISEEAMDLVRQAMGYRREVPSGADFQAYRHSEYPDWLDRVRKLLSQLPGWWSLKPRQARLTIIVRNDGATPADGFRFEYEVVGSSALLLPQSVLNKQFPSLDLPKPPKPPRVRYTNPMDQLAMIDTSPHRFDMPSIDGLRGQRDPYTFYPREESDKPSPKQEFECEEFRHESSETFNIGVLFPRTIESKGALIVRASARNIKRVEIVIPLEHAAEESDPIRLLEGAIESIGSTPAMNNSEE